MDTITATNSRLLGFTIVRRLSFEAAADGECSLELVLAHESYGDRTLTIRCLGVVALRVADLGGGLSQICGLNVQDISAQQWDRQHYAFVDLEHDVVYWRCRGITIE